MNQNPPPSPIRTPEQNVEFHALIGQLKFSKAAKRELVETVSGGRVSSSAELTEIEMDRAIKRLKEKIKSSIQKMRAKCYELYRDIAGLPPFLEYKFEQKDYDAVDKVMIRCYKKPLGALDYETLPKAVTTMTRWRDWGLDKAVKSAMHDALYK